MKAVVMAGGEGTRLRPLTSTQPKPMVPVAGRPMAEHVVRLLARHGIDDIVMTVASHAATLQTYFGDGSDFGVRIAYAVEETPLGTAGSVRNAASSLPEPFLVISGDVLTDIDLGAAVADHAASRALATIAVTATPRPLDFGVVVTGAHGSVERLLEKPSWGQVLSERVNTGVYVLDPEVLDLIPDGPADFSADVFPRLLGAGHPVHAHAAGGYWTDVGTLDAYLRAHRDVLDGMVDVDVPGFALAGGIWLGEGCEIDPAATVRGPAMIGDHCRIEAGAVVGEYSVLGANVRVGAGTVVERSVVHDGAYLGPNVSLRAAVVGRGSDLRRGARLDEGVVLGDGCFVGADAVCAAGVRVYPKKTVEAGAVVNSSIVWESRGARSPFGRTGVSGLANVDVSPELAMRLAMAFGTTMPRGSSVVVSRDTSRAGRVLARAAMVGLNSAGVDVADLEVATVPMTRFAVRSEHGRGAITVRLAPDDPDSVVIRLFDGEGTELGDAERRRVERLLHREEFRRSLAGEIGDLRHPLRTAEAYTAALMEGVDAAAVRSSGLKLVVDYASGSAGLVMPNVLGKLGAEVLAVNPYASTRQALVVDLAARAGRVADLVVASGADLGAVIDPSGERLTLVDDRGVVLGDGEALLAVLDLVLADPGTARVALPVSVGRAAEVRCAAAGADVVWARIGDGHVDRLAAGGDLTFAADGRGGFVFPSSSPAVDGVAALVHVAELLARHGRHLAERRAGLAMGALAHESVATPWDKRGQVMRLVLEEGVLGEGLTEGSSAGSSVVLVDGVKVGTADGWVLVVPDPDEPTTHVWVDAPVEGLARSRAAASARHIHDLIQR